MSKPLIIKIFCLLIVLFSIALGIHNASLFHPNNGFDGSGHIYYVNYLVDNHQIPPPTEWETHQPPLYYVVAASILSLFDSLKSVQYINVFVFWMIIAVVGLGLVKIFKNNNQVILGTLSLIALPMLNIFQPTITNELLNTFWTISAGVSSIYLYYAKSKKQFAVSFFFLLLSLVFGIWTKISIITILPTVFIAIMLSQKNIWKSLAYCAVVLIIFILAYTPIYLRTAGSTSPSNIITTSTNFRTVRPLNFFVRLDWIPKLDTANAQYYSFLGGGWNSFWTDGQNMITPFVPFHKKSFVLWSLGFILLPLSLYGLYKQFRENPKITIIISTMGLSMLGFFLFYNLVNNHYSAVRLTYEMGVVLPYAFGIAAASTNKKLLPFITFLLLFQFIMLVSFFWIQPWWFVTRDKIYD
jgi:hypothetical protein